MSLTGRAWQQAAWHGGRTARLDRTVGAIVFDWESTAATRRRAWSRAVRRRLEALSSAATHVAVVTGGRVREVDDQLGARPLGPGRLWIASSREGEVHEVEAGGCRPVAEAPPTPSGRDVMRAVLRLFAQQGVGSGLVLVVGTECARLCGLSGGEHPVLPEAARAILPEAGMRRQTWAGAPVGRGPHGLVALLDEQLLRVRYGLVPAIDHDPRWTLTETGIDHDRLRHAGTMMTLGAGCIATRGAVEETLPGSAPLVLAAGVYTGEGPDEHLQPGPAWTRLRITPPPTRDERVLDLRTGVLLRTELVDGSRTPVRTMRFASLALPGVMALRAQAAGGRLPPGPSLTAPAPGRADAPDAPDSADAPAPARDAPDAPAPAVGFSTERPQDTCHARVRNEHGESIRASAHESRGRVGSIRTVERLAAYVVRWSGSAGRSTPDTLLAAAREQGFDRLLAAQRQAWARCWSHVDVEIPEDPAAEIGIRFAVFQLRSNTCRARELGVAARGISGTGYAGHVFWDADVFVLPAMLSIDPLVARAMVAYRVNRLPAARANAAACGRRGARFPWESARTGEEVTPTSGLLGGETIPILTGEQEEHITADVAWAAMLETRWTGRGSEAPTPLLVETARYWASRCRRDEHGSAHIDTVIGPDEYHEGVDDNAFTNVMARWNLRTAAAALGPGELRGERREWLELADALVDGYDPGTGVYEQFTGYHGLEPLLAAQIAEPPFAADLLLSRERVSASQLIKQPDVLMLHHMVPDEVAPGSLPANLDVYLPRTSHGSSLSPAISASLLARAGRPDHALELLRMAIAIDLDDPAATVGGGLHMATLGGIWQAVISGFLGVRPVGGVLHVAPSVPSAWPRLLVRFVCLGAHVVVEVTPDEVVVSTDRPLDVRIDDSRRRPVVRPPARLIGEEESS